MKAIEVLKPGEITIVERPIPDCGENEVLYDAKKAFTVMDTNPAEVCKIVLTF
ncbi:hypothetical protein SAMN05660742_10946 [Propionispira arboris]|uniref:Uncharacterized protein n=1 Tax=Propionispira arboris TaxID=84035 RepID=A0A1H6ZFH5_9FIRM|nr:hypothetical protein [Propionispira arboris]SEJ50864.1 hypothetical protein SAMN05660742_10946 [Propionispira arboris]